ncbi:hypothetical protein ABZY68_27565 [Streptomyces sp. NPDC006482]|uniref:hypothetical protein n=1 Tax=Streptomyces sp. NPDC006482 TaxID=3154306 RepID=UPI0033A3FF63
MKYFRTAANPAPLDLFLTARKAPLGWWGLGHDESTAGLPGLVAGRRCAAPKMCDGYKDRPKGVQRLKRRTEQWAIGPPRQWGE